MKIAMLFVGAAVVIAALSWIGWMRAPATDDFDYAAAFEQPATMTPGTRVEVLALVGRSPAAVEAVLGAASGCERTLHSQRCRYAQSPVEIVFIAERADWFTIRIEGEDLPLASASLARLGLPVAEPVEVNQQESVWRDLAGLREVRLVGDEQGVRYARIKAITP